MFVVEPEAEHHVRVFQFSQMRPLEQRLMLLDRAADLPLFAIQVAENQVNLERVAARLGRRAQLLDRGIDLVRDEKVEPEHVMR